MSRQYFIDWLKNTACAEQISQQLKEWKVQGDIAWMLDSDRDGHISYLRAPTAEIGTWVRAKFYSDNVIALNRYSTTDYSELVFEKDHCQPTAATQHRASPDVAPDLVFSDQAVSKVVQTGDKGLIYVWSPHMPYSIRAIPTVQAVARRLGLRLILALDPFASKEMAAQAALKNHLPPDGLKPVTSLELINRDMTIHFPSLIVFNNGKIASGTYLGIHEPQQYEQFIKERL